MKKVSLTEFVDFAISSGTPKLTKVKEIKNRPEKYEPSHDFYKKIRERIIEFHQKNQKNKNSLDTLLTNLYEKKVGMYKSCLAGYKKFLGRKETKWFDPPTGIWKPTGINFKINPELGLEINNVKYVIKLYFKKEKLSKKKIEIILLLLHHKLARLASHGTMFCVLDVQRGKIFSTDSPNTSLMPLLLGEAHSFRIMWDQI